ncbi:MAG: chloride channel protein [Bacteroidetes bacterium]|nr:MAG: chloride channel protein [Bacteroidota bacterium]
MTLRFIIKKLSQIRKKHINNRDFLLLLSVVVGIFSGFMALIFKTLVFHLHHLLTDNFEFSYLLIFPLVGIGLTVLFRRYIIKDNVKHNISSILYAISKRKSVMKAHKIYSSIFGAIVTAGFGGSIGLESPIISSGAAFGSNLARYLRLDYKQVTLLLACGAAAAISAIFNTPIAGVIFALEVLMIDFSRFSLIPLLVASITGTITTKLLYEQEIFLKFVVTEHFTTDDIFYYLLLGILSGFISCYFTKIYILVQENFHKIKKFRNRIFLGSAILGLLIFLFPSLYGEGYEIVKEILNGDAIGIFRQSLFVNYIDNYFIFLGIFILLLFLKPIATSVTISAGGIGGIFAPSLFTGAILGFLFAFIFNSLGLGDTLSERNFALVGMACVLGGVLHAPLTGFFLIAEITGGYELFIPLMLATTVTYIVVKRIQPDSIFTIHLAKRGELITHNKDKAVLSFMKLKSVIETNFVTVHPDNTLGELIKVVAKSKRAIFPVVDEDNYLIGIVYLDDIREIMFNTEVYNTIFVHNLMVLPPAYISYFDTMDEVIKKFNDTNAWNLPVIDKAKYVGFVSKSKLFSVYRQLLVDISQEQ